MNPVARTRALCAAAVLFALAAPAIGAAAEEPSRQTLPPPRLEGGKPLMQALKERQSKREISPRPLEPQVLSDLLWAAFGVNRPEIDHRTAPSAMNSQEIDVYAAFAEGVYRYDARAHALLAVSTQDVRLKTGGGDFVKTAPLALILVADQARMVKAKPEVKDPYSWIDAGFVSQNIYLYCASAGLATVVHEIGDRRPLADALALRPEQKIIVAQAVGYPGPPGAKKAKK